MWRPTKKEVRYRNVWRKSVVTEKTISKLEHSFWNWLNDYEACLEADISPASLYRYINENPEFWEKKELLKHNISLIAKNNIANKIRKWDWFDSKRWLERKSKNEFSTKNEVDIGGQKDNPLKTLSDDQMLLIAQNITDLYKKE